MCGKSSKRPSGSRRWASAMALTGVLLAGCGGGGGAGGGSTLAPAPPTENPPTENPPAQAQGLVISTPTARVAPLQQLALTVANDGAAAQGGGPYDVEVDLDGTGAFAAASTVALPALVDGQSLVVAAPVLEMARTSATAAAPTRVVLRLRRIADARLSNTLQLPYDTIELPAAYRGEPSTALQLTFRAMFAESADPLNARAAPVRPGRLAEATRVLGGDGALTDLQAEAYRRQVFGVSAIGANMVGVRPSAVATSVRRASLLPEAVQAGFEAIFGCLGTTSDEVSADACFSTARLAVRDQIIPGLQDSQSRIADAASALSAMAGWGSRTFVGNYVERMVLSSEINAHVVDAAQLALTVPDVESDPAGIVDFVAGKITGKAKDRLYDRLTENLDVASDQILSMLGARDALNVLEDLWAPGTSSL